MRTIDAPRVDAVCSAGGGTQGSSPALLVWQRAATNYGRSGLHRAGLVPRATLKDPAAGHPTAGACEEAGDAFGSTGSCTCACATLLPRR